MTEKEKQQAGELYDVRDRELADKRNNIKKLCTEYNLAPYNDFQKKERLLDRIVALKGENIVVEPGFVCEYGYNIIIGDNFYAGHNFMVLDSAEIVFGDNVFIGSNCSVYTDVRPMDAETRNKGLKMAKPVKIGSNVSIGDNVAVMPGVTIGDNVVVESGSMIFEDIPSDSFASGNPCKVIKKI